MVKGQKSSATSSTRKKNARKAARESVSNVAPPSTVPQQSEPKDGKNTKLSKRQAREQRKKVYIPPMKPTPPVLDPLDTTGLVHLLLPELVVVLRALGKKDPTTRGKAIEELIRLVEDAIKEESARDRDHSRCEEGNGKADIVVKMLPVWLHHAPVLFTHPVRRLRHLAASLHLTLLRLGPARESLLVWTSDLVSQDDMEMLIGTWSMLAHDVDRGVTAVGMRSWTDLFATTSSPSVAATDIQDEHRIGSRDQPLRSRITLSTQFLISLLKFVQRAVLDPLGLHTALNPSPAIVIDPGYRGSSQGKSGQGRRVAQPKKGGPTPQSQQKGRDRYISTSSVSPLDLSSLPERTTESAGEENDLDRAGRLRVGALGVVRWILENWPGVELTPAADLSILTILLSSPTFWSTLHPASVSSHSDSVNERLCPFSVSPFGQGQPHVRQAAWTLVGPLASIFKGKLPGPLIRVLSAAILRSAWVEADVGVRAALGGPLIVFLREYSQAWTIDMKSASRGYNNLGICSGGGDESESGSSSSSEPDSEAEMDGDDVVVADAPIKLPPNEQLISEAYTEFLRFLELGCSGSPVEGYPLVLVVLAGIPNSILPATLPPGPLGGDQGRNEQVPDTHPITQLFTSLWAPLDAGLLDKRPAALSWLKAVTECLVLIIRRGVLVGNATDHANENAKSFLASQFSHIWGELMTKRLRVSELEAAGIIAREIEKLGRVGQDLFDASFDAFCSAVLHSIHTSRNALDIAPTFFHFFTSTFARDTHAGHKTQAVVDIYVQRVIEALETSLASPDQALVMDGARDPLTALVKLMDTFGSSLFDNRSLTSRIDAIFTAHPLVLLQVSAHGVLAYLRHRSAQSRGELQTQIFWTKLLGTFASSATNGNLSSLTPLVSAPLPTHLRGTHAAMDELVVRLVSSTISASTQENEETAVGDVLGSPVPFISSSCLITITSMLSNSIATFAEARAKFAGVSTSVLDEIPHQIEVGRTVGLVKKLAGSGYEFAGDIGAELYAAIFLLGYVIPYDGEASSSSWVEDAKALWSSWISNGADREQLMKEAAGSLVKEKLKRVVIDDNADTRPEHIVRCLTPSPPGIDADPLKDILPSREEFDTMLESLPSSITSPSLALLDPTFPTRSGAPTRPNSTYRMYTRATFALLACLIVSRTAARSNLWALHHILVLDFYANEYLRVEDVPDGLVMFDVTRNHLEDVVEKVKTLTTYLLGLVEDDIHAKVVGALTGKDNGLSPPENGSITSFVIAVARLAKEKDRVRDTAVLGIVLRHLFSSVTKDDANLWVDLARRMEKTAPQTSITILASVTIHAPEPPRLDRYRNELAASLIGIRPSAAGTLGLSTLRLLAATAPDPGSDVVFLPQQRAVNVMKACQAWVAADEDDEDGVNEDVESAMTLIFLYLAPILQNIPGSHWDFIWDVVENNLENCSLEDSATLTTLGRTLRLIIATNDLASTNKPLRANWDGRKSTVLKLTKELASINTISMPYSEPRALCREMALSVLQGLPSTMMNEETLPNMCHLLNDQSQEVQRMGYHLLTDAARKRTEHYVIEAGVDTEGVVKPELPLELLAILQQSFSSEDANDPDPHLITHNRVFGHLLAWMITFDLFNDASMKVRSSYFNQMRSLDIISQYFITNVFDILGLFNSGKQVFKLDIWAVDEFHLRSFESDDPLSLQLLAAHLYYRALLTIPALIRSWISDCTDKQLLARIVDYTSSYLSPGIIKAELVQIRQLDASSELSKTENLTIKVSPASGEVVASYVVDEQALELSIRMPHDWPLHRLEVRDTKMVGVPEDKWRAWVLGVQQIVWQQNGHIVDGLTLFAKNVALHFSGQVECAICYSIISAIDASLAQKPCKTCKNRFHASCLYKWFKSSHSSSCPLCRSDIL